MKRSPRTKKNNFQTFWIEQDILTVKNCKGCNSVGAKISKSYMNIQFRQKTVQIQAAVFHLELYSFLPNNPSDQRGPAKIRQKFGKKLYNSRRNTGVRNHTVFCRNYVISTADTRIRQRTVQIQALNNNQKRHLRRCFNNSDRNFT